MLLEVLADAERAAGAGEHDAPRPPGRRRPRRTASSSASLVATSRLFIASGRLSVMVATPSATSSSTGSRSWPQSVHPGLRRAGSGRRTGRRPASSRVASLVNSSAAGRPGPVAAAAASSGRPGSVKRNLRHSWTRWKRAAKAASSSSSGRSRSAPTRSSAAVRPRVVRRGEAGQVPARPGRGPVAVRRPHPAGASAGPREHLVEPRAARTGSPRRPARARRTRGSASSARSRASRAGRSRGSVDEDELPAAVPRLGVRGGRSGSPPSSRRWIGAVGWRGSPGRPASRTGLQPALRRPSARSPCARPGAAIPTGLEQPHQRRRPAPGCRGARRWSP